MEKPIYVIGYARVSTPKQAQTGESLDDQEDKIKKYCLKKGYTLFPNNTVFKEPYSGSSLARPVYKEVLNLIKNGVKSDTKIKYFIFGEFDRLTRGGSGDYDKIWKDMTPFGIDLRDIGETIQEEVNMVKDEFGYDYDYEWAKGRPSEEAERAKAEDARKQKRKILQTLLLPEMRLTAQGFQIGRPDYGFENRHVIVNNKKKCIQSRCEPEAGFVQRIFKLRAEGILSDKEICSDLNVLGYKSRVQNLWSKDRSRIIGTKGGKQLDVKQLQAIIARTVYCGVICEKWTGYKAIKAQYEGLVDLDMWNKANRGKVHLEPTEDPKIFTKLFNVSVHAQKRQKYNPIYPFKGLILCDVCSKPMKASASPGKSGKKFGSYHCERNHKRNAYSQKYLEPVVNDFFDDVKFTSEFISVFEKSVHLQFKEREGEVSDYVTKTNINITELEIEKAGLIKSFPLATIPEVRIGLEQEILSISDKIKQAESQIDTMELQELDVSNFIEWCKKTMEHPSEMLTDIRSEQELLAMSSLFFEKRPTVSEIVSGTPKLSLVFSLSEGYKVSNDLLGCLLGIEPRSKVPQTSVLTITP
jgi:Resolvase, N terminal domain/Recombinase